jgi:hypothetical protein
MPEEQGLEHATFSGSMSSDLICEVIEQAVHAGMLCQACVRLVQASAATQEPVAQSDFCADCVAIVNQLAVIELQGRLADELRKRGIAQDAMRLGSSN